LILSYIRNHTNKILQQIPAHRLLALDVLRGITITAMILVNNPGSWSHIYAPLKHAHWHGWTPTDLIFPFFIFIVGIAIALSIGGQISRGIKHRKIITTSAFRMLKLLMLGWFLSIFYYRFGDANFNWLESRVYMLRMMGVLQRIGIVYFATVLLFLYCRPKALIIWAITLLLVYTASMSLIPYVDGNGDVYQGLWIKGNNLSAWIDHHILGTAHVYSKTTPFSFDPEGLFSSLPAISTCLTGVLVGIYLQHSKKKELSLHHQVKIFIIVGVIGVAVGQTLHYWLPINKTLWTPSYVLLSSGFACIALAVCIYLVDIKKSRSWGAPFVVFGANSIAFFMFAGIIGRLLVIIPMNGIPIKAWIYNSFYLPALGPINGSLAFAISFLIVSYLAMHWMYRNNIFWKV